LLPIVGQTGLNLAFICAMGTDMKNDLHWVV